MRTSTKLKLIVITLTIILISLISFFGLYVMDKWKMKNLIPDYSFGMSLKGYKTAILTVDTSEKDAPAEEETENAEGEAATEGEEVTEETATEGEEAAEEPAVEGETTEGDAAAEEETKKVPVNPPEILTSENFKKSKKMVNTRLNLQKAPEYDIRQNVKDGTIVIDIINENESDSIIQNLYERGVFEARNQETGDVILTNSDVKNARVGYTQIETGETYLLMNITLNKEGAKKLEDITRTFVEQQTAEKAAAEEAAAVEETPEGETVVEGSMETETTDTSSDTTAAEPESKILELYLDTLKFGERSFEAVVTSGDLNVPIASSASVDLTTLDAESKYMAELIKSEPMPISYVIGNYVFAQPKLDNQLIAPIAIIAAILFVIFAVYFVFKYKYIGLFSMVNTIRIYCNIINYNQVDKFNNYRSRYIWNSYIYCFTNAFISTNNRSN